jgi:hypothetical protein
MTVYCLPPPARVEAAVQVMRDWIRGKEAAGDLDAAMQVVRDWLQGQCGSSPPFERNEDPAI